MRTQTDLFGHTRRVPRQNPRTMAVADAGDAPDGRTIGVLVCTACGHRTGWVRLRSPKVEANGRVCPKCKGTNDA